VLREKVSKADYNEIAKTYDVVRKILNKNLDVWMGIVKKYVDEENYEGEVRFLDLGGGTGRFALPIVERLGYRVTCADSSMEMLSKGVKKDVGGKVSWEMQDAKSLTYLDESFDVVFISHLLHHVDDPSAVIAESFRVLRKGGIIINRYAPMEQLIGDPEHSFFPEALEIDEARIPPKGKIERWCGDVGFEKVHIEVVEQQTWKTSWNRMEATKMKNTSTLHILSQQDPDAFKKGLKAMEKYVSRNPEDPWLVMDKITISKCKKV
jgi:ubiquinone/menaquinone biosynthesis C-methylase UbiE